MAEGKKSGGLGTAYLMLYNALQTGGWLAVVVIMCMHLLRHPYDFAGVFDAVEVPLAIFQYGALLEILHAAVGLVRSSAALTAMQVASRVLVVYLTSNVSGVRYNSATVLTITAWSVTEVIRYSFYFAGLINSVPYMLLWCRYTFFFILYPLGVLGELILVFSSLPQVRDTGLLSLTMPNKLNFAFDLTYFLVFFMIMYLPGFPALYMHMIAQRKKYLSPKPKSS